MNLPQLSNRLTACHGFIRPGSTVADIGCDHGYLGIHLLKDGTAGFVIAADINRMPLDSARQNAEKYGVTDKMAFYLSDGVQNIPKDFDTLVCAGMGADTMISILQGGPWLKSDRYRLVLQCQSRRPELRRYLYESGYRILRETLAEDGKFIYPVMEAVYEPSTPLSPAEYHISPALLASRSPLLPRFYERVVAGMRTTVAGLARSGSEKHSYYFTVLQELLSMEETIYGNRC